MSISTIRFTKMHGLGNDFVVIDTTRQSINSSMLPISKLADRHLGIGCDQILLIERSNKADFFCRILNADGSEAEQCGNGLRCVARFVQEKKLIKSNKLAIETIAGLFPIEVIDYDHIRVSIPAGEIGSEPMELQLSSPNITVSGSAVSIGNPHFIVNVPDLESLQINTIGQAISSHPSFPQGANVGFMQILNSGHIRLRTYERGAGATHACGSNACAAVATGILDGSLLPTVTVEFNDGQLMIEWDGKDKPIHMSGPASTVFEGEISLN